MAHAPGRSGARITAAPASTNDATVIALRALQHELHNALTPMAALAESARQHPHDQHLVELALRSAMELPARVGGITAAVLAAFGQIDTVQAADGTADADVHGVVRSLIERRQQACARREYTFHVEHDLAGALPAAVLDMVLTNLVLNAEAASGPESPIDITAREVWMPMGRGMIDAPASAIELTVRDMGRGMDASQDQGGSIVRSYNHSGRTTLRSTNEGRGGAGTGSGVQNDANGADSRGGSPAGAEAGRATGVGDTSTSGHAQAPGASGAPSLSKPSGVGLTICRRLLEMVGGRMKIESALGVGTTVRVWIASARKKAA